MKSDFYQIFNFNTKHKMTKTMNPLFNELVKIQKRVLAVIDRISIENITQFLNRAIKNASLDHNFCKDRLFKRLCKQFN